MPVVLWSIVGGVLCCVSDVEFWADATAANIKNARDAIKARFIYVSSWEQSDRQLLRNLNRIKVRGADYAGVGVASAHSAAFYLTADGLSSSGNP